MLKRNSLVSKLFVILLAWVLIINCFSGCSEQKGEKGECNFSFIDALGTEIKLDKIPNRVAALTGSFADIWLLSGGVICATAEDGFEDFGIKRDGVISLGGAHSPNFELLLSSNPDLVIASASSASNVQMKTAIENAGITVAYFDVDCFEDYLYMLDICTSITGKKELYKANGTDLKEKIESVKKEYKELNIPDYEKTVLLLRVSSGTVKSKGSEGTVLGEMLCDMGCINIADNDKSVLENLNAESIISKNPYHIFVVLMGDDTDKAIQNVNKMLKENPAYAGLDAVKHGRVHLMDKKLFNLKPNGRWAESYEILKAELIADRK